jgi:hypothetical protein
MVLMLGGLEFERYCLLEVEGVRAVRTTSSLRPTRRTLVIFIG